MILKEQNNQEIVIGNVEEQMFSIDDSNAMIFDILRNKLYSNKIGSISREIASNSRDAHREAGNTKNIEIEFTNDNFLSAIGDTAIIFRDFGNGISPDRMENIFLKYGASSKRDSNLQTGGFGLGAKVPMSYTDSFVIKTICDYAKPITEEQSFDEEDEDGTIRKVYRHVIVDYEPVKHLEFIYNAIIDNTGKGKMIKISELPTENPSGTEIIIPILSNDDRYKFEKEVYNSTMHWGNVTYINFRTGKPVVEYVIEDEDYKITSYREANFIGLLDGIPYEIKPEGAKYISGYTVLLNLDMSKLTINANRESLQYDEQTTKHVNEVYKIFLDKLEQKIKDFLSDNETFLKAYDKVKKLKNFHYGETDLQTFYRTLKTNNYASFNYDVTFNGENVGKISLPNHTVVHVKWLGTSSKYTQSTLSLDYPIVYLDKGGIRLPKNEKLDKFYLIKPDKSVAKDILEKEKEYLISLGIELTNYSEVKPDRVYVKPVKSDKVKIYLRGYGSPHTDKQEFYFDKTLKTIVGLDSEKVFFVPISDFRSHYNFRSPLSSDETKVLRYKKNYERIYYINENAFWKYLEPNGYKKARDVYKTIDLTEFTKYVEINRIKSTVNSIPAVIRNNFPEMLPKSIIKFMNDTPEEVPEILKTISWNKFLNLQPSRFNYNGVVKKYEDNLKTYYPLLPAYLNFHVKDEEEKIKNIKKYIELTKK